MIGFLFIASLCVCNCYISNSKILIKTFNKRNFQFRLFDQIKIKNTNTAGMKGFYTRPSMAIEKGGGFFIPGLEDQKIRILTSVSILFIIFTSQVINNQFTTTQLIISEIISIFTAMILFLQGVLLTLSQPAIIVETSSFLTLLQKSNDISLISNEFIGKQLLQTCEGLVYVLFVEKSQVIVEYGSVNRTILSSNKLSTINSIVYKNPGISSNFIMNNNSLNAIFQTEDEIYECYRINDEKYTIIGAKTKEILSNQKTWIECLLNLA